MRIALAFLVLSVLFLGWRLMPKRNKKVTTKAAMFVALPIAAASAIVLLVLFFAFFTTGKVI